MSYRGIEQARGDQRAGDEQEQEDKDGPSLCRRFPERLQDRLCEITTQPLHALSHLTLLLPFCASVTYTAQRFSVVRTSLRYVTESITQGIHGISQAGKYLSGEFLL